ncbi:MAG: hypothetical protein ACKVS6_10120 [Planctomycetota bacterium]
MQPTVSATGAVAVPSAEDVAAALAALPREFNNSAVNLIITESAGAIRAELIITIRGMNVGGRGRSADRDAAIRAAVSECLLKIAAHGAWIASQPECETVAATAAQTERLEYAGAATVRNLFVPRRMAPARAWIEWELSGNATFTFVNSDDNCINVLARSEDGRFEKLVIVHTPAK